MMSIYKRQPQIKSIFLVVLLTVIVGITGFSQRLDYNLDGKFIAEGYDVVSYFNGAPKKGKPEFVYTYKNVKLKFSSQSNLKAFKANPEIYFPQYGGWCAYAMGLNGKKVSIDPMTYEIRDNKLYLFYNAWGTNTLELWLKENPERLKSKADINWVKAKIKKKG